MPDLEAVEVLLQAKERIMECGWATGVAANREGEGSETSLCLEDALCGRGKYVANLPLHPEQAAALRAANYIKSTLGLLDEENLWRWNDHQDSASNVFDVLDEALLAAKESENPYFTAQDA